MLVGLGFVLALLASLIASRLFWLYTARRRLHAARRTAPVAQGTLEAERDRLRVENAMLLRKLDTTTTSLKQQLAERMAQAARYRNRLDAAQAELTRLRLAQPLAPRAPSPSPADDAAEARLRRRATDVDEGLDLASAEAEATELEGELQTRIKALGRKPKG